MQTDTRWSRVLVLWGCGILAGMQFAKVSVAFQDLQALYGVTPAQMGWVLSTVGMVAPAVRSLMAVSAISAASDSLKSAEISSGSFLQEVKRVTVERVKASRMSR